MEKDKFYFVKLTTSSQDKTMLITYQADAKASWVVETQSSIQRVTSSEAEGVLMRAKELLNHTQGELTVGNFSDLLKKLE